MGLFRDIGAPGLIVLILGALFFGPKRLPELGEAIGKMFREFKKSVSEIEESIDKKDTKETKAEDEKNS